MTELEDFLEHHGVKGMKWGVRNRRSIRERKARAKRSQISKRRRTLSDGDIKAYITRLQDERKLRDLINEDLSPGKTAAKKIMSESGQKVAKAVATGAMMYGMKLAMDKKFGERDPKTGKVPNPKINPKDAADYMLPKPKSK